MCISGKRAQLKLSISHPAVSLRNGGVAFGGGKVAHTLVGTEWPATKGQAGGCRCLGAGRGQRCVRSVQSPADGLSSLRAWFPWGLPRLYALRGMGRGLLSAVGFRCSCGPLWGLQGRFSYDGILIYSVCY